MLSSSLVFCFTAYGYFINRTVLNVLAHGVSQSEIDKMDASLAELDLRYLSLKNGITIELAEGMGFRQVSASKFVSGIPSPKLTLNNEL